MVWCRPKPVACESDSGEDCVSPASPVSAPAATRKSPPGLNEMEMEVANELRAMQRGVPSTSERRPVASSPLCEISASQVGYKCSRRMSVDCMLPSAIQEYTPPKVA